MCGELCLVQMRQEKYILEKKTYKEPTYITKQDRLYKNKFPAAYRYHVFVKFKIVSKDGSDIYTGMYENQKYTVKLQNMDGYFWFENIRKKQMLELLDSIK